MKRNSRRVLTYKQYKKFKNREINRKLKKWLSEILPNQYQPDLPKNPNESIPTPEL